MIRNLNFSTTILIYVVMIVRTNGRNLGESPGPEKLLQDIQNPYQSENLKHNLYILIRTPKKSQQDSQVILPSYGSNQLRIDDSTLIKTNKKTDGIEDYEFSQKLPNGRLRQSIFHYFMNPLLNIHQNDHQIKNTVKNTENVSIISNHLLEEVRKLKNNNLNDLQHMNDILNNNDIIIEVEEFKGERDRIPDIDKYIAKKFANFIESQKQSTNSFEVATPSNTFIQNTNTQDLTKDDTDDVKGRWETPISIVNAIESVKGETNMEWETEPITVHLARSEAGDIQLWWAKPTDSVYLQKVVNDGIDQDWCFGDVHINVTLRWKAEGSSMSQSWEFGVTEMKYLKDVNGNVSVNWKDDKRDEELLKKYQKYIMSWCDENGALFDKDNCVIFNR